MEIKKQLIDNMNESFDDKVADIADLVGEKGEVVRDRLKTLNFRDYIELSKAVKQNDMEDARRILGLGIEETEYKYDGKLVHISKEEFSKVSDDYKNSTPGEERMVILDPESGATISVPVKFMNEEKSAWFESYQFIAEEKCRYCGGDCPDDPNHACDGFIGDIDNLYGSYDEDDEEDLNEDEKKIAADIKDYVDDHKKHFDAYPMDVEVDDKIYDYDEYWKMLDKYYPVKEYNTGGTQGTMSPGEMRGAQAQAQAGAEQGQETNPQNKTKKAQAMQRLGKKNLGGATAQQAADALDKAGQGKPLTPIQRKAMAQQAASVDQLAADPKTAVQFRNLLNKLNNQGK